MSPAVVLNHKKSMQSYGRDTCPDYNSAVSRSNSDATTASRNVHWPSSEQSSIAPLNLQRPSPPLLKRERYLYTYNLLAPGTPLQFLISVEPMSGKSFPGKCTFRLSFRANGIERSICEPVVFRLHVDPRRLDFAVFIFPGKSSIPVGSLYSLRVWLRVNGVDHRVFADDELWVGKDLDFHSIANASFVRLKSVDSKSQVYHGFVGRALVTFTCRWHRVNENTYKYSLDYEANGVGANLFEDLRLRIDGDPRTVTFLIYSVPINSVPAGSSHRIRVWLKSLVNLSANTPAALPFHDSYIYQRIWKSDTFKIGARLDFESMSNKAIMGFAAGAPQMIMTSAARTPPPTAPSGDFPEEKTQRGYHE
ncbi:hypothetical protein D9615_000711 [Tricholomella constricta]|uniref:Uncharacterized protein n=1 Tax=Tricholomella constricta TaxID=117010 RepID=A0A8H5MAR7_9AGAR|nr:hypothetical protein D9615_000711 [Tricholomella constricta]